MISTILIIVGIYTVARLILAIAGFCIAFVCAPETTSRLLIKVCDKGTARNEALKADAVAFRTKRGWQS